jgi:hypothetical protein
MRIQSGLITSTLVAALALGSVDLASPVLAADNSPVASKSSQASKAPVTTPSLVLIRNKMVFDNATVPVGAGFQPIDPGVTLVCPFGASCVITAEQNVQVRGAAASNRWAICTQVNGVFMSEPLCPFLGFVPVGSFGANSFEQHRSIGPGTHFIRTFLFTDFGADRSIYHLEYSIYRT